MACTVVLLGRELPWPGVAYLPGFFLGMTAGYVVLTWIYNRTAGSILIAALWRGALNLTTGSRRSRRNHPGCSNHGDYGLGHHPAPGRAAGAPPGPPRPLGLPTRITPFHRRRATHAGTAIAMSRRSQRVAS